MNLMNYFSPLRSILSRNPITSKLFPIIHTFPYPDINRRLTSNVNIEEEIINKLQKTIQNERILVFIKGSPQSPQCQYSYKMIEILNNYKSNDYAYIDVLSHEKLRDCVKRVSGWPTFPQLFVSGKLVGGCDIVGELHDRGELKELFGDV